MNDLQQLGEIVDNGSTHVTIPTPPGWKCPRENCATDYKHSHSTYPSLEQKFVFFRENLFHPIGEPLTRLTEKEARMYIGATGRNVERVITQLKAGKSVRTRFGTYTARALP